MVDLILIASQFENHFLLKLQILIDFDKSSSSGPDILQEELSFIKSNLSMKSRYGFFEQKDCVRRVASYFPTFFLYAKDALSMFFVGLNDQFTPFSF